MKGSQKQIDWAMKILEKRALVAQKAIDFINTQPAGTNEQMAVRTKAISDLGLLCNPDSSVNDNAGYIIDGRNFRYVVADAQDIDR